MATISLSGRDLLAIAVRIDEMRKIEKAVRNINTTACNYELTPRQEKRREKLESRYAELAATFGLFTEHQRDPRGSALKLHDSLKDMDSSMGGDTLMTTKTTHTPGPWKIVNRSIAKDPLDLSARMVDDSVGRFVAKTGTTVHISLEVQAANARLIAAAPELLRAVKDALMLAELHDLEGAAIDNYRRVITKAEGVSTAEGK